MDQTKTFVVFTKGVSAEKATEWLNTLVGKHTKGDRPAQVSRLITFQIVYLTHGGAAGVFDVFAQVEGQLNEDGDPKSYEVH
jgi:hypothetical protein